jgi:hypothetical protein
MPPIRILALSLASLFYVLVDILPAAILFTDLTCSCETEDCMGDTVACRSSRYSIYILLLMFYSLLVQLMRLAVQIDWRLKGLRVLTLYAKFGDHINWYCLPLPPPPCCSLPRLPLSHSLSLRRTMCFVRLCLCTLLSFVVYCSCIVLNQV